jgi:hypothetical protein
VCRIDVIDEHATIVHPIVLKQRMLFHCP